MPCGACSGSSRASPSRRGGGLPPGRPAPRNCGVSRVRSGEAESRPCEERFNWADDEQSESVEILLSRPAFATASDVPHASRGREEARGVRRVLRKNHGRPEAQAPGAVGGRTAEVSKPAAGSPRPFRLEVPNEAIADLRLRLERARWPDEPPLEPWSTGTSVAYLQDLTSYWRTRFDWRSWEAKLNAFRQF